MIIFKLCVVALIFNLGVSQQSIFCYIIINALITFCLSLFCEKIDAFDFSKHKKGEVKYTDKEGKAITLKVEKEGGPNFFKSLKRSTLFQILNKCGFNMKFFYIV